MYGEIGVEVQPLTPGIALSTRAQIGVVVTAVNPEGPAAGLLEVTDVIVGIGDEPLSTYEHWNAIASRVTVGQTLTLLVQRDEQVQTIMLTAVAPIVAAPQAQPLGLTMRSVPRVGVEVSDVAQESAAAAAGILPGDVITVFGDRKAPTPAEVRARFAAAPADRPVLVAVTRGAAHHVLTIEKR